MWHHRRRGLPRTEDGTTENLRAVEVQTGVRLDIYWSVVSQGAGPCASLFVLDEEVLRIDCFAGDSAHMHINPVQLNLPLAWDITPRLAFPPGNALEQIERGVFELTKNTQTALQMNQLAKLRRFKIDERALAKAGDTMREYMQELTETLASPDKDNSSKPKS
jgi:hypothetical protein